MNDADLKLVAVDSIFYYLNDPKKYSKDYISSNFEIAIRILSNSIKEYMACNGNIKSETLGQESVTYRDKTIEGLVLDIKGILPTPKPKCGVVFC